jgi:hypothetical protein
MPRISTPETIKNKPPTLEKQLLAPALEHAGNALAPARCDMDLAFGRSGIEAPYSA